MKIFRGHLRPSDEDFIDGLAELIAESHVSTEAKLNALAADVADGIAACLVAKGYRIERGLKNEHRWTVGMHDGERKAWCLDCGLERKPRTWPCMNPGLGLADPNGKGYGPPPGKPKRVVDLIAELHTSIETEQSTLAADLAEAIAACLIAKGYRVCFQCGGRAMPQPTNIGRRTAAGLGPPVCAEYPDCQPMKKPKRPRSR